jgi:hypothetical protein
MFDTIDLEALDDITGGRGEGVLGWARVGLVGLSMATGNPEIKAPRVEPIRIEQTMPTISPPTQR